MVAVAVVGVNSGKPPQQAGVTLDRGCDSRFSCFGYYHDVDELTVRIPDGVTFEDLELELEADGALTFNVDVIERIRLASGLPVEVLEDEDTVANLIIGWYAAHLELGGEPNEAAEELIAEVEAEDAAGQPFSLPPGRA